MRVKLTSENILKNFDMWNLTTQSPSGWYAANGVYGGASWNISSADVLYSATEFNFMNTFTNIRDYIDVYKSVTASGDGTYKPCIDTTAITLTDDSTEYPILASEAELSTNKLNQQYVSGDGVNITELGCIFEIETTMLRNPTYSENITSTPLIVRNKNSKTLIMAEEQKPINIQLGFILCAEQSRAVQAFFNTCIKYAVGFNLEIIEEGEDTNTWASDVWAGVWGSATGDEQYKGPFKMDLPSTSFIEEAVNGNLTVPIILQKSEIKYVSY